MSNTAGVARERASSRVVFFGRRCRLSAEPLRALLDAGLDVAAVIVPAKRVPGRATPALRLLAPSASRTRLPMARPLVESTVDDLVVAARVPIVEVGERWHREVVAYLGSLSAAAYAVSCFPFRLPPAVLDLPTCAALNAHPSLLPRHRGPDPLFWTYREFDRQAGVSVHLMSDRLDAGDLVAREPIDLPPGLPGDALEDACGRLAARLLLDATRAALAGTLRSQPQAACEATYEGWPEPSDLALDPRWTAERAHHFARGVIPLGYEPTLRFDGHERVVRNVLGWSDDPHNPANTLDGTVLVPWRDGALRVRLAPPPAPPG